MYITAQKSISPQHTHDNSFFEGQVIKLEGNKYFAQEPNYLEHIPANVLRRMGKALRMGIGAGMPLLKQNGKVNGIIIGSSEGGLEDCIRFLNQIVDYDEGSLTPTNFVQSTPNALAGNLAIMTDNPCYNNTHTHKGNAFENALIDAMLLFSDSSVESVLVGNVEEISDYNYNIEKLAGQFKTEDTNSETLLLSKTEGTVCGEGACMFVLNKSASDYSAKLVDVTQIAYPTKEELVERVISFLNKNGLTQLEVSALILGHSGDIRSDHWYCDLYEILFREIPAFSFKNFVGDYPTASAFGMFLAVEALCGKKVTAWDNFPNDAKYILIYNHYKGEQHGFILLETNK